MLGRVLDWLGRRAYQQKVRSGDYVPMMIDCLGGEEIPVVAIVEKDCLGRRTGALDLTPVTRDFSRVGVRHHIDPGDDIEREGPIFMENFCHAAGCGQNGENCFARRCRQGRERE